MLPHENKDKTETRITEEQQMKVKKYFHSLHLKPGQKAWKFSLVTGILEEVMYKQTVHFDPATGKSYTKKTAEYEEKTIYVCSINRKNAQKKVDKFFSE